MFNLYRFLHKKIITKYIVISLAIFSIGFISYIYFFLNLDIENSSFCVNENQSTTIDYSKMSLLNISIPFLNIFLNNLLVGLVLAYLGYLSAGILTSLVLFWNGFLLAVIMVLGYYNLEFNQMLYLTKHIPLELYALFLFAEFGFKGFTFYKKIILTNNFDYSELLKFKKLVVPVILLFIASIIETI